jgi:hypothetical protein
MKADRGIICQVPSMRSQLWGRVTNVDEDDVLRGFPDTTAPV